MHAASFGASHPTSPSRHCTPRPQQHIAMSAAPTPVTTTPTAITLADIPARYDALLLDQFGVLHNGKTPYPGAIAAVQHLRKAGTQMLILSNSSRRASGALGNLGRMGFPLDAFSGVITSGEVTHAALTARASPFWAARHRCVHFTWADRGAISLEGLGVEVVQDPDDADFVLAHGTEALGVGVDGVGAHRQLLPMLKAVLQACAARNLPLVVANPDVVTVHGTELRTMPGTLARWYAEFGGEVHLMGKPAGVMYDGALALLGGVERHRVLAVGDSLEHDVAGACGAGIDSVLVAGGIHAAQLLSEGTIKVNGAGLAQLCDEYGAAPRYVMPFFEC